MYVMIYFYTRTKVPIAMPPRRKKKKKKKKKKKSADKYFSHKKRKNTKGYTMVGRVLPPMFNKNLKIMYIQPNQTEWHLFLLVLYVVSS